MTSKEDHFHLKEVLTETITLLCKNGLHFKEEFCVEALIGVTLDKENIVLLNIKEMFKLPVSEDIDKEYHCDTDSQKSFNSNDTITQNMLDEESTTKSFTVADKTMSEISHSEANNGENIDRMELSLENKLNYGGTSNETKSNSSTTQEFCEISRPVKKSNEVEENKDNDVLIVKEEHFNYPCANKYNDLPTNCAFPPDFNRNPGISHGYFSGYNHMHHGSWSYPLHKASQDTQSSVPEKCRGNMQKAKGAHSTSQQHEKQLSSPTASSNMNNRQFHCDPCGKSYSNAHGLWRHKQVEHLRCSGAVCSQCGKSFTRKDHMLRHLRSEHLKIGSVLCPYCSKVFYRKDKLTLHLNRCQMALKAPNTTSASSVVNSSQNRVANVENPQIVNYTNLLSPSFYQNLDCHLNSGFPELQIKSELLQTNQNRPVFPGITPHFSNMRTLNHASLGCTENVPAGLNNRVQQQNTNSPSGNNVKQNENITLSTNQNV